MRFIGAILCTLALFVTDCRDVGVGNISRGAAAESTVSAALKPYVEVSETKFLLTEVTLIPGDGFAVRRDQWVLVEEGVIVSTGSMESTPKAENVKVISLRGHTVIPGIIGMHNHLHMPGNTLLEYTAPRLYLVGGVTTIATAGAADAMGELELAKRIDDGKVPGPTIFASAPYISGPGGNAPMDKPVSVEEAKQFVDEWVERGVSWFKIYRHTEPVIASAIIERAHEHGLKVTGHLCSITYAQAAMMGIDSIEHGVSAASDFVIDRSPGECVSTWRSLAETGLASEEVNQLVALLIENDVTITSTLAILETSFAHRPQADERSLRALSASRVEAYRRRQPQLLADAAASVATPELWSIMTGFERRFVEAGGHLVAGPDTGRHILPGYGDQRNFELLVEAGLSVPQAIKIMSSNGADTLGISHEVGRIRPGLAADLVVLEGDLTGDPSIIRNVRLVFKDGIGFDPDALIADVEGQVGDR